jgi:hypothetical protein
VEKPSDKNYLLPKRCPFCGGDRIGFSVENGRAWRECTCGARGPWIVYHMSDPEPRAIERATDEWNRRIEDGKTE